MLPEPNYIEEVAKQLAIPSAGIKTVLELTQEGATVPFIARYRQEKTGGLDENQIRDIIKTEISLKSIYKAKNQAIEGITELDMMTDALMDNILKASTLKQVEELYKPYKSKKKTKAMLAIEAGFQPVADTIKTNTYPHSL